MIEILIVFGIILLLVGGTILFTISWLISSFNFFKSTKEAIKTQWSNIITEYDRRIDLFLNLASTVKSLKDHEYNTLTSIAQYRSGIIKGSKGEQLKAMSKIESMITGIFERYPNLTANKAHEDLMTEITITEERINSARTGYNEVVREYNTNVETFPRNIIAARYGFKVESYYESAKKDVLVAPVIKL